MIDNNRSVTFKVVSGTPTTPEIEEAIVNDYVNNNFLFKDLVKKYNTSIGIGKGRIERILRERNINKQNTYSPKNKKIYLFIESIGVKEFFMPLIERNISFRSISVYFGIRDSVLKKYFLKNYGFNYQEHMGSKHVRGKLNDKIMKECFGVVYNNSLLKSQKH